LYTYEGVVKEGNLPSEREAMWGICTVDDVRDPGLKTALLYVVCVATEVASSLYSIPVGLKYVKIWHHSVYNPIFIEYAIEELTEMMYRLNEALSCKGIPYHFSILNLNI